MKKLTKQYLELVDNLSDIKYNAPFLDELDEKLREILDIKEVYEFKHALPTTTTLQFQSIMEAVHRAFIEGYLLANMEDNESCGTSDKYGLIKTVQQEDKENEENNININELPISIRVFVPNGLTDK